MNSSRMDKLVPRKIPADVFTDLFSSGEKVWERLLRRDLQRACRVTSPLPLDVGYCVQTNFDWVRERKTPNNVL